MNGSGSSLWRGVVVVALVICAPSCRKPSDAVKSDLKQAGYQLTAEDWFRASRSNEVSALTKFVSSGFNLDTRDGPGSDKSCKDAPRTCGFFFSQVTL